MLRTVPSGWCQTFCAGPAAFPAPAMTSLVRTSTWISRKPMLAMKHGLEAAMCRRTAAQLRNRPRLESWPVSLHLAHTKRVTRLPSPCTGPATGTLARLAMIATVVSKSVETDHVIAYCANFGVQLDPVSILDCTRRSLRRLGQARGCTEKKLKYYSHRSACDGTIEGGSYG